MTDRLFGSDGYRGPYNPDGGPEQINAETFEGLAYAYASLAHERTGEAPVFVVGGDTRPSTEELVEAASRGMAAAGAEVWNVGVALTPTIAWIAQKHGVNALAVTASHNAAADNGFKPFEVGGVKPSRDVLDAIEARYRQQLASGNPLPRAAGAIVNRFELVDDYVAHLTDVIGEGSLANTLVVVDGANGAASELAPRLYKALGAEVVRFACDVADGVINDGVGAAHLNGVQTFLAARPDITNDRRFIGAFASDGDGDRVMGVDMNGNIVDGNHWMKELADKQAGIVGTLYTNSALRQAVKAEGVEFHECNNGDSNVTALLHELTAARGDGYTRGGEFTGHLIDTNHLPSGDGLFMGAALARDLAARGESLADLHAKLPLWPEMIKNVRVGNANAAAIVKGEIMQTALAEVQETYGDAARVLVRASGTEPLIRVWAEAPEAETVRAVVGGLAARALTAIA